MRGEPVLYVYLDVAFLLNLLADLILLWTAGRLAGVVLRPWRLGGAAVLGAVLAVWAYFPTGRWLTSWYGVFLGTVAVIAAAFWPCQPRQALRASLYFLFSAGLLAGGAMLLAGRSGRPAAVGPPFSFPGALTAAGLMLCWTGTRTLWEAARARQRLSRGLYGLRVEFCEKEVEVAALVDTGNALQDPLSGTPVAVVEVSALREVLPEAVLDAVQAGWEGLRNLPDSWTARCRIIPFRSVGQSAGALLAVRPDQMLIREPGQERWDPVSGLVGLSAEALHQDGVYRALLPPHLLEGVRGEMWEGETG